MDAYIVMAYTNRGSYIDSVWYTYEAAQKRVAELPNAAGGVFVAELQGDSPSQVIR